MTTTLALHPDAVTAKYRAIKDWRDALAPRTQVHDERQEFLAHWSVSRLEGGELYLSARIVGADPAGALLAFETRQATRIATFGDPDGGDRLPALDCTVPGRTACVWRTAGAWVEVWHPDTPTPRPTAPVAALRPVPKPGPPRTSPSGRLPISHRLTAIRRALTTKEN